MWPTSSHPRAFHDRRQRLVARFPGPVLLPAGSSRPRNFPANRYAFRAESHFLYFVGRGVEDAALLVADGAVTLFVPEPDPEAAVWTGPTPSLEQLSEQLGLQVRPLEELEPPPNTATLPPQDLPSAFWLAELLDRDLEAGDGASLEGVDAELADAIIAVRLRHDAAAIAQLEQAAVVTVAAHRAGMARTRPGLREAAVRAAMEAEIIAQGMTTSYGSIVTVHGEVLHNERHDGLLGPGDLVLADVGAETPEGWAGDVTRTWPVSGRFLSEQRELYDLVLAAQRAAIDAVRPGVRYLDVHRTAGRVLVSGLTELGILRGEVEDLLQRGAGALFFPHGIGHLLGLDVHDMEDLGDRAGYAPGRERSDRPGDRYLRLDRDLEPGMVVTIEPGFYRIERILERAEEVGDLEDALRRDVLGKYASVRGIRIEDDVLVTDGAARVLTDALPKTADEIEALVGV